MTDAEDGRRQAESELGDDVKRRRHLSPERRVSRRRKTKNTCDRKGKALGGAGECEAGERDFGEWSSSAVCCGQGGFVLNDAAVDGFAERIWLTVKTKFTVAAVAGDGLAGGAPASD